MGVEPAWLTAQDILATHDEQIRLFGGLQGVRDAGLIESALGSVQNVFHYQGETDALRSAAHLALGWPAIIRSRTEQAHRAFGDAAVL